MVIDFQYFFLCHYYLNNFIQKAGKANKFAKRRQRLDYPEDFISRFYIQAHFSRRTKSRLKKIRKRHFLDATISLATDFVRFSL